MKDYERNIIENIERFGCSVTSVVDPDGKQPSFSYSIGIVRSCGAAEMIVVGLDPRLGSALVNTYNDRAQSGRRFLPGVDYDEFLEGFVVRFAPVAREARERYLRSACWLHGGPDFEALQLVWPDTAGVWPWQQGASEWLRTNQPLLWEASLDSAG